MGCDADISAFHALVTYRINAIPKSKTRGELVAIDFVPANFRVMTDDEMNAATLVIYDEGDSPGLPPPVGAPPIMPSAADFEAERREMIMQSIRDAVRKPADGEKREMESSGGTTDSNRHRCYPVKIRGHRFK